MISFGGKTVQLTFVVAIGHAVVRGQSNVSILLLGAERWVVTTVEQVEVTLRQLIVAQMVEDVQESRILLSVNLLQLQGDIGRLSQRMAAKEIRRVIVWTQQLLIGRRDNGCQLLQVTNHQKLHTAKRSVAMTIPSEHRVNGIEQVTAHHTDFIDDEHVERTDDFALLSAEIISVLNHRIGHEG